ncbi:MAG: hypothetical protein OXF03_09605, partial [Gammaproteobacteria bacterium]|nr:hypothetical protein [Gammaproteobacteria bacterium]
VLKADVAEIKQDIVVLKADIAGMNRTMATKEDLERSGKQTLIGGIAIAGMLFAALKLFA